MLYASKLMDFISFLLSVLMKYRYIITNNFNQLRYVDTSGSLTHFKSFFH